MPRFSGRRNEKRWSLFLMKRTIGLEINSGFLELHVPLNNIRYIESGFYLFNGCHKKFSILQLFFTFFSYIFICNVFSRVFSSESGTGRYQSSDYNILFESSEFVLPAH